MDTFRCALGVFAGLLLLISSAHAQNCEPAFSPDMAQTRLDGASGQVFDMVEFDEGQGPRIIAGGLFRSAGSSYAMNVARSTPTLGWEPMGEGLRGLVRALEVFNDGSGPRLYAGGNFSSAGTQDSGIRRWNGTTWESIGGPDGTVFDLQVWNSVSGAALYACGSFSTVGGVMCNGIARWNGTSWSRLGDGISGKLNSMSIWDSPTGPKLAVAGFFTRVGTQNANGMAFWNGGAWEPFSAGPTPVEVFAVGQYIKPGVRELWFATSDFANPVRKWNGTAVQNVSVPFFGGGTVSSIRQAVEGGEESLLLLGSFTTSFASGSMRWNGSVFRSLTTPSVTPTGPVWCSAAHRFTGDASPRRLLGGAFSMYLVVGGQSGLCGPVLTLLPARNGVAPMQSLLTLPGVRALGLAGASRTLIAGGSFGVVPGLPGMPQSLAQWNSQTSAWEALSEGVNGAVTAMIPIGDSRLLVGGSFPATTRNQSLQYLGVFDGQRWQSMRGPGAEGRGSPFQIVSLATGFESGVQVHYAGTNSFSRPLLRWDGTRWTELNALANATLLGLALADLNDGAGPVLYAAGGISLAGTTTQVPVARATAAGWAAVGTELRTGSANCVAAFDLGGGRALYAGGQLGLSQPGSPNTISFWPVAVLDRGQWKPVGTNMTGSARSLMVMDDGRGPALYAAGDLKVNGSAAGMGLARFDGQWWNLVDNSFDGNAHVLLTDPVEAQSLYIGGDFSRVGGFTGVRQSGVAHLVGCPICPADWNRDGGVDAADVEAFFEAWEESVPRADINRDGSVDLQDVSSFFEVWEAGGC